MLWPDSIVLDDVPLSLDDVLADVTIHHGRADVDDEPAATTCQIALRDVDKSFVKDFRTGVELVVTVSDGTTSVPRFRGLVSDAHLEVDDLVAIAVGRLSTLGRYPVGSSPWPAETWTARLERIFAEAGLAAELELYPDPTFDPELAGRDPSTAGPTTLGDYLSFLVPMVGAAVTDRPDGRILVQTIGSRSLDGSLALDPDDVAFAPIWEMVLPSANVVTVRYQGDQSESVTIRDEASIDLYGERPRTIDTSFVELTDATRRANERLARGAFPHWNIPEAPIVRGLELRVGEPVTLSEMPASSPFEPWTPIVEGWQDSISGDEWTMLVSLSDPLASGLILPWNTVPLELAWDETNPATSWAEALTLGELYA